jgi:hypothetical protein
MLAVVLYRAAVYERSPDEHVRVERPSRLHQVFFLHIEPQWAVSYSRLTRCCLPPNVVDVRAHHRPRRAALHPMDDHGFRIGASLYAVGELTHIAVISGQPRPHHMRIP